jgi:hypothetical protein
MRVRVNVKTYQKPLVFVDSRCATPLIMKQGVLCEQTNIKIAEAMDACQWFSEATSP